MQRLHFQKKDQFDHKIRLLFSMTFQESKFHLFKAVWVKIFKSKDIEDSDCTLVLIRAKLVVVLPVDGHVDLLHNVDEEATVDALGKRISDVPALVGVQGGHLEMEKGKKFKLKSNSL